MDIAEIGRDNVLKAIEQQLLLLEGTEFARLIPEVGSNIAYATENAKVANDVAAIPGRIRNAMGKPVYLRPQFGASKHVASIILAAMNYDPSKRCAMNIRYSENIISALEYTGLKVVFVDRMAEPIEVQNTEGSSIPWVLQKAYEKAGKVPDVIYHKGAIGKEAITQILGENPGQVVDTILKILNSL